MGSSNTTLLYSSYFCGHPSEDCGLTLVAMGWIWALQAPSSVGNEINHAWKITYKDVTAQDYLRCGILF